MPTPVVFQGVDSAHADPSDSTGAIGTTRYVELVNIQYGIYDRFGSSVNSGDLSQLAGMSTTTLTDPQVIWDYATDRFYYLILDKGTNHFAFGFSMTDSPSSQNDFCSYDVDLGFGSKLPDYPKLGDTQDFLFVGYNGFVHGNYTGSGLSYLVKPVTGAGPVTSCPGTLFGGDVSSALNANAWTPVPAHQVDVSHTGWITTTQQVDCGGCKSNAIAVITVSDQGGIPVFGPPRSVKVPSFSMPPDAEQPGGVRIDTLDGRLTQAIAAFDPAHNGIAVWTQHTIAAAGGRLSQVAWYEIAPTAATLFQHGTVGQNGAFVYNAAISPDRQVDGSTFGYGEDMALGFNTSSANSYVAIQMVTKSGPSPQSGFQLIKSSSSAENSAGGCQQPTNPDDCRWGDYSGASPDPLAGQADVWFTNASVNQRFCFPIPGCSSWQTWNWEAVTQPAGKIVATIQPSPSGNGRAMAFDPKTGHLFYTLFRDTNIYVVGTGGTAIQTLASGIQIGALSWDPKRHVLWAGAYDGTGDVFTINPITGTAALAFAFPFPVGDNCFEQQPGYIDGLAYDRSTDTLWLSDDAGTILFHTDRLGRVLSSTPIPYGACNSGIAVAGKHLWLAIFQNPDTGPFYYLLLDKANLNDVLGQVPFTDPGGPEGIAYDAVTFPNDCVLWVDNFGLSNQLTAVDLQPLCP